MKLTRNRLQAMAKFEPYIIKLQLSKSPTSLHLLLPGWVDMNLDNFYIVRSYPKAEVMFTYFTIHSKNSYLHSQEI